MKKNIVLIVALVTAFLCTGCINKDKTKKVVADTVAKQEVVETVAKIKENTPPQKVVTKKTKLYVSPEDVDIPLSAVTQISELSQNIKNIIEQQIKDTEVYYLGVQKDKVVILKEVADSEERFTRHDFEVINISLADGKVSKETKFPLKMNNEESDTEIWKYEVVDDDVIVPSSHTSLNIDGSIKTIETWNYDGDALQYKVTDGEDRVISVRKTSKADNGSWRDEHVFYDENGNTALNVSKVYENNNISRLTYFNSTSPETSAIVVNEYEDDSKVKEMVYSSDYKLKNSYTSIYKDGEILGIKVFDANNQEAAEYIAGGK